MEEITFLCYSLLCIFSYFLANNTVKLNNMSESTGIFSLKRSGQVFISQMMLPFLLHPFLIHQSHLLLIITHLFHVTFVLLCKLRVHFWFVTYASMTSLQTNVIGLHEKTFCNMLPKHCWVRYCICVVDGGLLTPPYQETGRSKVKTLLLSSRDQ